MPSLKALKDVTGEGRALELTARNKGGKEVILELSLFSETVGNQRRIIRYFS
jgi:hypothetical protein